MQRRPSCCDFCGDAQTLQEYPTDHGVRSWYACTDCARIIEAEDWQQLIERNLAAYAQIRAIPDADEPILRKHVEDLVEAFRAIRLVAV